MDLSDVRQYQSLPRHGYSTVSDSGIAFTTIVFVSRHARLRSPRDKGNLNSRMDRVVLSNCGLMFQPYFGYQAHIWT